MSITIQQGGRSWTAELDNMDTMIRQVKIDTVQAFKAAFKKSVNTAFQWVLSNVIPFVAKDTDLMRVGLENAFEENYNIIISNNIAEFEYEFNLARFLNDVGYAKYHIKQHPEFRYPLGYVIPSTFLTRPIDLIFLDAVEFIINRELPYNLALWGFAP